MQHLTFSIAPRLRRTLAHMWILRFTNLELLQRLHSASAKSHRSSRRLSAPEFSEVPQNSRFGRLGDTTLFAS